MAHEALFLNLSDFVFKSVKFYQLFLRLLENFVQFCKGVEPLALVLAEVFFQILAQVVELPAHVVVFDPLHE